MKGCKKGIVGLGQLPGIAMSFMLIAIIVAVGLVVLLTIQENPLISGNDLANNTINNATAGLAAMTNTLPLIGVLVGLAVVIGIVVAAFVFGGRRSS